MILPCLYVSATEQMGRGVFTEEALDAGTIIELSPVIVMNADDRKLLDKTLLHDYIFEWGNNECCVALGYVSVYNHSYASNCEYEMVIDEEFIRIKTMRHINAGEELFINYNGTWNNKKPVWFDAR